MRQVICDICQKTVEDGEETRVLIVYATTDLEDAPESELCSACAAKLHVLMHPEDADAYDSGPWKIVKKQIRGAGPL
jgi:hypothetical protein